MYFHFEYGQGFWYSLSNTLPSNTYLDPKKRFFACAMKSTIPFFKYRKSTKMFENKMHICYNNGYY